MRDLNLLKGKYSIEDQILYWHGYNYFGFIFFWRLFVYKSNKITFKIVKTEKNESQVTKWGFTNKPKVVNEGLYKYI